MAQWVKITTNQFDDFIYRIIINDLDSSTISCGNKCSIVKLATTPFTNSGTLHIGIRLKVDCGSSGSVEIPFKTTNGYLSTPIINYHIPVEGNYCVFTSVKAVVSGSAEKGYQVSLIGTPLNL